MLGKAFWLPTGSGGDGGGDLTQLDEVVHTTTATSMRSGRGSATGISSCGARSALTGAASTDDIRLQVGNRDGPLGCDSYRWARAQHDNRWHSTDL